MKPGSGISHFYGMRSGVGPLMMTRDDDWVRSHTAGDPAAFRRIFDAHARGIHRFLCDQLRSKAAADDATQETFIRAFERLATLRDPGLLRPWLFGFARNLVHEQRRARRVDPETSAPDRVDPALGPEAAMLEREADRLLESALGAIAEDRRAALLLRTDHGLSYEEVAEVMGWPLAKVKNEIHRARLELRQKLGWYVGGES